MNKVATTTVFESTVSGNWKPFQCVESGSTLATGPSREKAGPISRIRRCHVDFALVFLHAGCTLASVHLVFNRAFWRRQRHSIQLAMEVGQCHPEPLFVHLVQWLERPRTCQWAVQEDHVRHGTLLYHDVHDQRRLRQRRRWDRQREDLHHLHDDHSWWAKWQFQAFCMFKLFLNHILWNHQKNLSFQFCYSRENLIN